MNRLIDLIARRLDLARDVAWAKFHTGAPVYDPGRERAVLQALVAKATEAGISPSLAAIFFTAQIAASRQVQIELIDGWKGGATKPATRPLDLQRDIRPRIDSLSEQLLAALAVRPSRPVDLASLTAVQMSLRARGYSAAVASLAAQGLAGASSDPR